MSKKHDKHIMVWALVLVLMVVGITVSVNAEVPQTITVQGRLTDSLGNPVADGDYEITFTIYNHATVGTTLWSSGARTVPVAKSLFTYQLGSAVQLPVNLFATDTIRYLGITVGTDPEIVPRTRLTSGSYVYYALRADTAAYAFSSPDGGGWTDDGTVVRLSTTSDSVGIGTAAPGYPLQVEGKAISGANSDASGAYAAVGGGFNNTGSGDTSTTSGGAFNTASGCASTISGGIFNSTEGDYGTVGGGMLDTASASASTVGGGAHNVASDLGCTIGGGIGNFAGSGQGSTVSGGRNNTATGLDAAIGGGKHNRTSNSYAVVGGGHSDTASGSASVVAGGRSNIASGDESTVGGGLFNTASGLESVAAGGRSNTASGDTSTVSGGGYNSASNSGSTVGGGISNSAEALWSTVGGGHNGTASGNYSTVAGGCNNSASYTGCTVGGGYGNTASQAASTVAGGIANTASGDGSAVAGGNSNTATGIKSAVGGGLYNYVSGDYACIPGGERDTVIGDNSMAFGKGIYVNAASTVVFFDGSVSGRLSINRDGHDGLSLVPLRVGTSTSNGNGAFLTNGGTWTNGSSRSFKENFQPLNGRELLEKISALPVDTWNYKNTDERHIGPVAEDFVAAFDVGVIREEDGLRENHYLAASDVAGVALVAVKELYQKTQKIDELETRVTQLEALVETLLAQRSTESSEPVFGINK